MTPTDIYRLALDIRPLSPLQRHVRFTWIRARYGHDVAEQVRKIVEARARA